jgi:hypothetical protein
MALPQEIILRNGHIFLVENHSPHEVLSLETTNDRSLVISGIGAMAEKVDLVVVELLCNE